MFASLVTGLDRSRPLTVITASYSSVSPSTMSKKGASKNDLKGLTYVAQKPAFLTNFGQPTPSTSSGGRRGGGDGREPLPSRPDDGEWAGGSDNEGGGSDDEWGDVYGGGGDEGPQVVVLKEGRHLSADEVKRERRRGMSMLRASNKLSYRESLIPVAAGKPSQSPEPESTKTEGNTDPSATKKISQLPPKSQSSAKRKLVTKNKEDEDAAKDGSKKDAGGAGGGKKKKKSDKKLLSFNEDE